MIGWQVKLGFALAVAGLVGFLIWKDHYNVKRLTALRADYKTLSATLKSEREARATEQEDRRKADAIAESLQSELASIRAEPRITGVRLCPRLPTASSQSGSASGTESATPGRVEATPAEDTGRDISDELDAYATDCAAVGAVARKWQEFDATRTH